LNECAYIHFIYGQCTANTRTSVEIYSRTEELTPYPSRMGR